MAHSSFELKRSSSGTYYFTLTSANGERLLASSFYRSRSGARKGIASVRANAGLEPQFQRFGRHDLHASFSLKASNGEVIGLSRLYACITLMEADIDLIKVSAPTAPVVDRTRSTSRGGRSVSKAACAIIRRMMVAGQEMNPDLIPDHGRGLTT